MMIAGPWHAAAELSERAVWPPGALTAADEARFARYVESLSFYHGEQWPAPTRKGTRQLVFNYARALIRKSASYVFPGPVTFSIAPGDIGSAAQAKANEAERLLAGIVQALDLARLDLALAVDAAILGDAAVKVTWDTTRKRPRVVAVDPATLVVRTAADDPRAIASVTQAYGLTGSQIAAMLPDGGTGIADLDPERGYPVVETWTDARWQMQVAGQIVHDGPNPCGWIPYAIATNDPRPFAFWGQSDLTDLVDVCVEINQRMTVLSRVLELSGAPIAVLENVDGSEGISVGPGAKWELPEGAKAYLLDLLEGGGTEVHLSYVAQLFSILHDLSETPKTAFGDSGRDLSGAALEVEIQPLVQKVARKRRMWDAFFAERNFRLLDLLERFGGHDLGGLRQTTTLWPPVLPSDTDSAVRNAV
ncbi:MAG TPA: phage portal protein, partial [Thermomicrobiales bacterium]|nr:phage portal protein [Thermomicrobiales bacterium]